jgi:lambda family phage portal protein
MGGYPMLARVRSLCQNNPVAKRFMQLYITNVIGPNGHTFQPNVSDQVLEPDTKKFKSVPDIEANAKIHDRWKEWTKTGNCTMDGRNSFAGFSKLVGKTKARDGEVFIRKVKDADGLKLHLIPVEMLDYGYNEKFAGGNVVINGVELNAWRRPVAYWMRKPRLEDEIYGMMSFSTGGERDRLPAEQIIHWVDQEYDTQTRGITSFAQTILDIFNLGRYENAGLVNATAAASKMGFFGSPEDQEGTEMTGDTTDAEGNIVIEAEAGTFQDIGNRKFYPWDPQFPQQQHEMYVRSLLRKIASGLGVAYSSLANDYSSANYSSLRAELLVERENWKTEQQSFIDQVLKPVFTAWLEMEILSGSLKLPFSKFAKYNNPSFIGPRWPWVDPTKDVVAQRMEVESLFKSPFDVVAEKGESSYEQILQDSEEAAELAKKHNLKPVYESKQAVTSDAQTDPTAAPPMPQEPPAEDEIMKPMKRELEGLRKENGEIFAAIAKVNEKIQTSAPQAFNLTMPPITLKRTSLGHGFSAWMQLNLEIKQDRVAVKRTVDFVKKDGQLMGAEIVEVPEPTNGHEPEPITS